MTKDRLFRRVGLVALAATLGLAGCGDNAGNPVGYGPEGQAGTAVLLVNTIPTAADSSSLSVLATVLSPPPADGFRIYLNPADQGYRPASDAPVPPVITLTSGWSVYQTIVEGYDPTLNSEIVARGSRNGLESLAAPVSNVAYIPAAPPVELLRLADIALDQPLDSSVVSNQPTLTWLPSPGATRYVLQLIDPTGAITYTAIVSGTSHQVGVGPGLILHALPLRNTGLYKWTVQAFDGGSRLFGLSREDRAFFVSIPVTP